MNTEKLRCREQTYGRSDTCEQYLRTHEKAWRSFIKWSAKEGLVGRLVTYVDTWEYNGRTCSRTRYTRIDGLDYGGLGYVHGYPQFHASSGHARDLWEREFEVHRKAAIEALRIQVQRARDEYWRAREIKDRIRFINKKTTLFFRCLSVGKALAK